MAICTGLEARGVSCWIAPRDVAFDGTYGTEIMKGLRECDVFLILGLVALCPAHPIAVIVPAALLLAIVVTWRLIVAFGVYLRFRHAAATVLASQIIVLLLVLVVILQNRNAHELLFSL